MFVPSMHCIADVMAESAYTEEQVFDLGVGGTLVFLVVVPELGACRVPAAALSHFMAGADDYTAEAMPEHYSGALSGRWNIKRDRLRILCKSWEKWTQDVWEIDRLSTALEAAPEPQAATPASLVAGSAEKRQARRWQMCIDAGLPMPTDTYSHLPRGIGKIAEALKITRQALQQDLNTHRERLFGK